MSYLPISKLLVKDTNQRLSRRYQISCALLLVSLALFAGALQWRIRSVQAAGTITGAVFVDFNANGANDTTGAAPNVAVDKGLAGVTVTAYDAAGATQGSATTIANGTYSLDATGTGPYRLEFTNLPAGYQPSARSTDSVNGGTAANSGSTVQFVPDLNTANVNLAVNYPEDYCQNNPSLCTTVMRPGNASLTRSSVVTFPYTNPTAQAVLSNENVTGAVWGAAYQPTTKTLFVSSMMKRHAGFGPLGITGGIYKVDLSTGTPTAANYINLQTIGLNTGANPRATAGYTLPNSGATPHWDYAAYTQVGKIGVGDIDYDAQRNTLWFINLADRRLHGLANVNPATTPTNANVLKDSTGTAGFLVNTSPAITCTNGVLRPWAVKPYRGLIYVGAVCTGESTGATAANLSAYVLSFNPDNASAGFTQVLTFALNYSRVQVTFGGSVPWQPWVNSDSNVNAATNGDLAQPIVSDLEFDNDGSIIMGLADRWGDQVAGNQYRADPTQTNTTLTPESYGQGDMLRFCKNGSAFANPGTAQCPNNARPAGEGSSGGNGPNQGPGNGEFYGGDWGPDDPDSFGEIGHGAMAFLPGSGSVVTTVHDSRSYYSGGAQWLSNTNGGNQTGYDVYITTSLNTTDTFNKGNGLGDIELLCDKAPIEIGNRVWNDINANGRQDPNTTEAGVGSVAVELWADTDGNNVAETQVGSATTDANGEYYFGGANKTNMLGNSSCSTTVAAAIDASANDAEQTGATVSITGGTLDLARTAGGADNTVGLRFANLNIPQGANVTSATISFNARNSDTASPVNLTIRGENNDTAAAFTTANNDISSRPATTQSVAWSTIGSWTLDTATNATTPNLETVVEAIAGRSGWTPGNSMAFIVSNNGTTGTNSRRGKSFDNSTANAPVLSVTYQCRLEVQPNTRYEVRVPAANFTTGQPLNGFQLTQLNADTDANATIDANDDRRDSDGTNAIINGGGNSVLVAFTTRATGNNDHSFDFGFRLSSGNPVNLGNRVFLDNGGGTAANANNGTFNIGESGVSGVTVELYNSGGTTLLATTATDSSGYYSFPGLTSGTAYQVRLAAANFNTGSSLANYGSSTGNGSEGATTPDANLVGSTDSSDKGTTTGVLGAGGYVQTRVAVTLTAGSCPTLEENGSGIANPDANNQLKVDFGLINYSLGNRVWLDNGTGTGGVANDGVLNGSELGIANVSVSLFADATCDGAIDTPANPLATVTTDTAGYYRFDNLKTVCYIVRVNPTNFTTGNALANLSSSATTVNAGSNTTDSRDNGIDNASPSTNGILTNSINLASKTKPTGETNPAAGYGSGATNGTAAPDTADDLTIDFGFRQNAPTAVTMSDFQAFADGATTLLQWRSGSETDNLGYFVYRQSGKGQPVRLTDEPIAGSAFKVAPGATLTAGDTYNWRVEFVAGAQYYLEAVALNGKKQQFGPVAAKTDAAAVARAAAAPPARLLSQLAASHAATPTVPLLPKAARAAMRLEIGADSEAQQRRLAAGAAVKIGVKQSGWYRVTGAQLAAAGLGRAVEARFLELYADGQPVPCLIRTERGGDTGPLGEAGTLEFYGFGLDERESDTRTYWLAANAQPGLRYGAPARVAPRGGNEKEADGTGASSSPSFLTTVERKERTIYFSALNNGEETENFFGAGIVRAQVNQTLNLTHIDGTANSPARLEVALQGASTGSHRVRVQLNGNLLGFAEWGGQTKHSQRFDIVHSALQEGVNTVTLNAEADGDVSLTDYLRVVYARRYTAADGQLFFTVNPRQTAQVSGFNTPNVRLFDMTEPRRAFQIAARVESNANGFAVNAPAGFNTRALFAVSDDQALSPAFVNANEPSAWTRAENSADFLIVTPKAFRAAAETLAQTRQSQGLRTAVVNLEDIFDELTGGSKRVSALRSFLRYANQRWNHPAQYVLFLGDASYDARDYLNLGGHDLVPTGYVATTYLETMSDESLTDFDGDGVGDMSVGRFPARTLAQAQAIVNKTLAYQPRPLNNGGALLIADQPDGYNFAQMNQQTAEALPDGTNATHWTRGAQPDAQFRQALLGALNQGPALVNFAGHGSVETWTGAGLLQSQDAAQLNNNAQLTVYVMLTCLNGYFGDETSESLAEALLKAPHGGAVAVWASTGLTAAPGQQLAGREFYRLAYGATPQRLGDAARTAKRATNDPEVRSTWTLFADPTLLVR